MAAEYGEEYKRPHYHACIFGYDFPDKTLWKVRDGIPIYTSDLLERVWGKGFCTIGDVTFESAAYCARYVMKKINGKKADQIDEKTGLTHYERVHPYTGEICQVEPEFNGMSLKPGIGAGFFDKYTNDIFPWDHCIVNGYENRPPRYYDKLFEVYDPEALAKVKTDRVEKMARHRHDNTPARLADREQVAEAKISFLKREVE